MPNPQQALREAPLLAWGQASLALYRMAGMERAILLLFQLLSDSLPISRISIICGSPVERIFMSIADTQDDSGCKHRHLLRKQYAVVAAEAFTRPVFINDLAPYKQNALDKDPDAGQLPFFSHAALLRLPLFTQGNYTFLINFWSDTCDVFQETHIELLQGVIAPLAEELHTDMQYFPLQFGGTPPEQDLSDGYLKLGLCPGLTPVRRAVDDIAPTDVTVLISGETGTGKEIVAEAIHERSRRSPKPFVRVNCGAIAESLFETELFGHEKGAFTGAASRRIGYAEYAAGGTLFLDEIGELSQPMQVKLLRLLDRKVVQRVGSSQAVKVDIRIIAATNQNLAEMVANRQFREDLYYRLRVFPIHIPPLRERNTDILPLIRYFLPQKASMLGIQPPVWPRTKDIDVLLRHRWPGNVRELEHVVEHALMLARRRGGAPDSVMASLLPATPAGKAQSLTDDWPTLEELKRRYIAQVLQKTKGRLTGEGGASGILGIHYTTLRAYLDKKGAGSAKKQA